MRINKHITKLCKFYSFIQSFIVMPMLGNLISPDYKIEYIYYPIVSIPAPGSRPGGEQHPVTAYVQDFFTIPAKIELR